MTKSKYRSSKTKPATKEPHRGGGAWQDALDRLHISLFQAEYERKCPRRKGKEVVRACAKGYLDKFEGKMRSQFNVKNGYPEAQEIKDTDAWKAYVVERTEVWLSYLHVSSYSTSSLSILEDRECPPIQYVAWCWKKES
jgi:hypothetical protein